MMWQLIEVMLICAGALHARLAHRGSLGEMAEMSLVYLLAGYCGVMMFAVGVVAVVNPDWIATNMAMVPTGNPVMIWAGFFFIGLAIISIMTIWWRGKFLVAPVLTWSIYWAGASYAHIVADTLRGHKMTANSIIETFIGHGLTAVIILALAAVCWRGSRSEVAA
jgi:hypothetical protein